MKILVNIIVILYPQSQGS